MWVLIFIFYKNGKADLHHIEGFTEQAHCVAAKTEIRKELQTQYFGNYIFLTCKQVQHR